MERISGDGKNKIKGSFYLKNRRHTHHSSSLYLSEDILINTILIQTFWALGEILTPGNVSS